MLARLTIRPQPRSRMPGTTARHMWNVPVTLTANVVAHSSSLTSQSGLFGPTMPAELTRMSTRPIRARAAATAPASVTSATTSASSDRSRVTTVIASWASRSALARPMPLAPPVMTATRSMVSLPWRQARSVDGWPGFLMASTVS